MIAFTNIQYSGASTSVSTSSPQTLRKRKSDEDEQGADVSRRDWFHGGFGCLDSQFPYARV
jgi:hypothetical protein